MEANSGCFRSSSHHCQHYMIFDTLIKLTNTAVCNRSRCNAICMRTFNFKVNTWSETVNYSCCEDHDLIPNNLNISQCLLTNPEYLFPFVDYFILMLSIICGLLIWHELTKIIITSLGRYCHIIELPLIFINLKC